jgi:hypothetical protein
MKLNAYQMSHYDQFIYQKPYAIQGSKKFLGAVKSDDRSTVEKMLLKDRTFAFVYDSEG